MRLVSRVALAVWLRVFCSVSRRHCTFLRDGAELLLLDHSRFGSFVNGERVAERARVRAGDEVRVGDPGVTLALIAVGETPVP